MTTPKITKEELHDWRCSCENASWDGQGLQGLPSPLDCHYTLKLISEVERLREENSRLFHESMTPLFSQRKASARLHTALLEDLIGLLGEFKNQEDHWLIGGSLGGTHLHSPSECMQMLYYLGIIKNRLSELIQKHGGKTDE